MTKKTILAALAVAASTLSANAGGINTNSNQSVAFLRNPARDAAIGIDGVYSNPAGVALLKDGFHIGVTWQTAIQTRTVETTSPYLDHTLNTLTQNEKGEIVPKEGVPYPTKQYRGHATAPIVPSVQAAYNKSKWSFQFGFAVNGGGGKCEFSKGLGSFENAVGNIAASLMKFNAYGFGVNGYSADSYMEGSNYFYGVTLGAAYKVVDKDDLKLSVYGGLRGLIGSANYKAQIKDIQVASNGELMTLDQYVGANENNFKDFFNTQAATLADKKRSVEEANAAYNANPALIEAGAAMNVEDAVNAKKAHDNYAVYQAQFAEREAQLAKGQKEMETLNNYRTGLYLECDQSGFGIAPILGFDLQYKRFNIAAKYEFRTKMNLKNSSKLAEASIPQTEQFVGGTKVREDSPAILTLGAQYSPIDIVRLNFGYHHYYDLSAKKFGDKQDLLEKGTNEYLGGVEVDATDRLILSTGFQITRYGLTDAYMSDISFVTNSWSFGFGASYQANPNVKIEAAYFKTLYSNYKTATDGGICYDFTRDNDVIGVGLVVNL